jgi:hypothetical protein
MNITSEAESVIRDLQSIVKTRRSQHEAEISGQRPMVLQRATTVLSKLLEAHAAEEACIDRQRGSQAYTAQLGQLIDELKTLRAKASEPLA